MASTTSKEQVTKVWIEEGCIVCDACETAAPTVFEVQEETCIIRPEALSAEFTKPLSEEIVDAAEECPVDVIKFETVTEEVTSEQAEPAAGAAPAGDVKQSDAEEAPPAPAPKAPVAAPVAAASTPVEASTTSSKQVSVPKTSMAGDPDPAIAALLKAATARGGNAGIIQQQEAVPQTVQSWKGKDPRDLPPDARREKVLEAARKARQDPDARRRKFMGDAALTVGWVAFGSGLGISVGPAFARFMMPNVLEEPDPRVRVGKLQRYLEMAPGEVIEDYKPQGVWLVRDRNRLAALSIICTHLGCIPNWLPNDHKFKCPCHGSGYHSNGINFEGPTPRPLERFRMYIDDGIVVVDMSKKYRYELGQWNQRGSYIEL